MENGKKTTVYMVQLADSDITTDEVLGYEGIHVFHFVRSSCSQKLRIFLNLKDIEWTSHHVDLLAKENLTPWYMGINPRGLVPTLVHNGQVHIESNDIMLYLEQQFPAPRLIPKGMEKRMQELLRHEDELHLDLRAISFRFVYAPPKSPKSAEDLERYATTGTGSVAGQRDDAKAKQIAFWEHYAAAGVTDEDACRSVAKFRASFDALEKDLTDGPYLLGEDLSVLDIAWFIYANRLTLAGYPMERLHPHLANWLDRLREKPEFAREVEVSPELRKLIDQNRKLHLETGRDLQRVAGL
jgi:glutathione S-transferase